MLRLFRKSLSTGIVTTAYPDQQDAPAPGYRGLPIRDAEKCQACERCAEICPTKAITLSHDQNTFFQEAKRLPEPSGVGFNWKIDPKRCLFCGYCEDVCPSALKLSSTYELSEQAKSEYLLKARESQDESEVQNLAWKEKLGRSIQIRHLDGGSCNACDWEMTTLTGPVYDVQRLGFDFVASPRHADLLMVTGPVTRNLEIAVRRTFNATPAPKIVVAVGTCACSGGICGQSYASAGGVDQILPVDVYIPGCPPRPQALIQGLLQAMKPNR